MWTRLRAQNFMALQDVEIPLAPMTVFVGKSGCGKSSALLAAWTLARLLRPEVLKTAAGGTRDHTNELHFGGPWATRRTARAGLAFSLTAQAPGVSLSVFSGAGRLYRGGKPAPARIELTRDGQPPRNLLPEPVEEHEIDPDWERGPSLATEADFAAYHSNRVLEELGHTFTQVSYHRFNSDRMSTVSIPDFAAPGLAVDGGNLAAHLSLLAGERPELFAELGERLRAVIPRARRLRVVREQVRRRVSTRMVEGDRARDVELDREDWGFRVEVEMEGEGFIAADLLSEGTVMTLGVLVAALGSMEPHLLLLDDLDRALHPSAHTALVERLREIVRDRPGLQIVCTSHSPYIVNAFSPEEIVVFARDNDGRGKVHARALVDHPRWSAWDGTLLPGEFWSGQGERWIEELSEGQA